MKQYTLFFRANQELRDKIEKARAKSEKLAGVKVAFSSVVRALIEKGLAR